MREGDRKPSVTSKHEKEGGQVTVSPSVSRFERGRGCGCVGGWEGTFGREGDRNSMRWHVESLVGLRCLSVNRLEGIF